jgi:hypothetical protein
MTQQSEFFEHAIGPVVSVFQVAGAPWHPASPEPDPEPVPEPPSCFVLPLSTVVPSRTPESLLSVPTGDVPELQATSARVKAKAAAERGRRFMGDSSRR